MSEIDNEWALEIPFDIEETAKNVINDLLPKKSKERYNLTFDKFTAWQTTRNVKTVSEPVMLTYFKELSEIMLPSTLWSNYSMLKSTLRLKSNFDIGKYNLLTAFLKRNSVGFHSKKSKILTAEHVERFLKEAPDVEYLATKVCNVQ